MPVQRVLPQLPGFLDQALKGDRFDRAVAQAAPDILAGTMAQALEVVTFSLKNDGMAGATLRSVWGHAVAQRHRLMLCEQFRELSGRGFDQPVIREGLIHP